MPEKSVKKFEIQYLQVLDENGNADEKLMPKMPPADIKKLYETMVLARTFDDKAFNLQRQGRIGTYIQFKGQEAAQIASAFALEDADFLFPMYRSSAALLARKQPMHQILQYWGGDVRGLKAPEGVNNFPVAIPVGTQGIHAVGAAFAAKYRKTKQVSIVYFGDGASSKGDMLEAMNFAGVWNAPVIFLCEDNKYAISVPRSKQTKAETIAQKAIAFGFEGRQVDGNDVFAVYKAVSEAIAKARAGKGPTLIECDTYRIGDHSTSDDAARYRDAKELEAWKKKDPVERLEKYMKKKGLLNDEYKKKTAENAKKQVEKAVDDYEKIVPQKMEELFAFTYSELTEQQKEELQELQGK